MKQALLYDNKDKNHVQCHACSWHCNISPGKTGACGVRKNIDGELYSLVYGKPVSVQVDPIEKKPFYHFLPRSPVLSIGTIGCNFQCQFCQNWGISQKPKKIAKNKSSDLEKIIDHNESWSPERIVKHCKERNIPIIAYTYNEPAVFFRYAYDTARLAYKNGIKNVYVSNGFESKDAIEKIAPYLDAINIDLKSFSNNFYKKLCKAKIEPVKRNIKDIINNHKNVWLEITTLLIPGENDSEQEIKNIAQFIANIDKNIPWHISRFYPAYKMKDKPATDQKTIEKAYQIGRKAGLNFIYPGNISHKIAKNTLCPNCNEIVVNRTGYDIDVKIEKNTCPNCGFVIPGIWQNFTF